MKLWNITNFVMLFQAVMNFCLDQNFSYKGKGPFVDQNFSYKGKGPFVMTNFLYNLMFEA
jgi:hypothetical protein